MNLFRSRIRVFGAVVAFGLLVAACGSASETDVASVGESSSLSRDQLDELVEGSPDGTVPKVEANEAITNWVRNELWYAELEERGFEIDSAHFDEARRQLEFASQTNPEVPDLDSALGEQVIRTQALPVIVIDYLLNAEGVEPVWPVQLCSSHILLETEEEALAAIERLDAGEDFASLAMELSTGPSGPTGGDLGCVDPAGFVPEFVEGASEVDPPGISAPVESEFGWHVIEVRSFDATPSDDPAIIENAVFSSEEFLSLRDEVQDREVTIDPEFGTWDSETSTVIPAG